MTQSQQPAVPSPRPWAVIVTYHASDHVVTLTRRLLEECGKVLVVDNGSAPEILSALGRITDVQVLPQPLNIGVAAALNIGAQIAESAGTDWLLTMDQDSMPQPGMVAALLAAAARNPLAAQVGPAIDEPTRAAADYKWTRPAWGPFFRRDRCMAGADLPRVTCLITSGCLVRLKDWRLLGGWDEGLFIDYVDVDFSLRVLRAGLDNVATGSAVLRHSLGNRTEGRLLGKAWRPTHHSALRLRYMARNRIALLRRHAVRLPHWAAFDLAFMVYNNTRVVLFEKDKLAKLGALLRGTWDGLLGRSGPIH